MSKFTRGHKLAVTALISYWVGIFTLTHIPIPRMVASAGISDKLMHFLAYLLLTLFLWAAFFPDKKVNWIKWQSWFVIALTASYGGMDELLQKFVGRTACIDDFFANMIGVVTCMLVLSSLSFWPAAMIVWGIFVYILPNFTTGSLFAQHYLINAGFHFFGFAGFTMIWIQVMNRFLPVQESNFKWPSLAVLIPLIFLAALKITSVIVGKSVWKIDIITATIAILITVAVSWPTSFFRYKIKQRKDDNSVYRW